MSEMGNLFALYTGDNIFVYIPDEKKAYIIPYPADTDKMIEVPTYTNDSIESICERAKQIQADKSFGNP